MMLAQNVLHFARLLRRIGLRVGASESLAAVQALTLIDISDRDSVHDALRAVMIRTREDLPLFDQAFELFWRAPQDFAPPATGSLDKMAPGERRLAEAMAQGQSDAAQVREAQKNAAGTANARERLNRMDFEAMGAAEITAAKAAIRTLRLPLDERRTRRWRRAAPAAASISPPPSAPLYAPAARSWLWKRAATARARRRWSCSATFPVP